MTLGLKRFRILLCMNLSSDCASCQGRFLLGVCGESGPMLRDGACGVEQDTATYKRICKRLSKILVSQAAWLPGIEWKTGRKPKMRRNWSKSRMAHGAKGKTSPNMAKKIPFFRHFWAVVSPFRAIFSIFRQGPFAKRGKHGPTWRKKVPSFHHFWAIVPHFGPIFLFFGKAP